VRGAVRWALSPVDCRVHLLASTGDHPWGAPQARCGAVLPPQVACQPERSRWGAYRTCPTCALIAQRPVSVPAHPWAPRPPTTFEGQPGAGRRVTVRAMWVRCRVDQHLHLLGARAVLDLAALGFTVAYCGALLITPQLVVRGGGTACGQCLAAGSA
jgi:hypothetical protein